MTPTIQDLAGETGFETRKRDDGTVYVTVRDDAPEWITDMVRRAHGDMLPDDWRYAAIDSALEAISESDPADMDDLGHAWADANVDVYTRDRLTWLASHLHRPGYCDQAREDGLTGPDTDIVAMIGLGQYIELTEVFSAVLEYLRTRADDLAAMTEEA